MSKRFFDPDSEYSELLKYDDKSKALSFLRVEADNFINLKHMLEECKDDEDYDILLPQMLEAVGHIRTTKLGYLRKQFCFFSFRAKRYLKRLLEEEGA